MNPKSENNKYDIVLEAEAVLAAYSERCKVYAKKSLKRRKRPLKKTLALLVFAAFILGSAWWLINLF